MLRRVFSRVDAIFKMIVIVSVVVFALSRGSFGSQGCRESAKCDQSLLPKDYPRTYEQFKTNCQNVVSFLECVNDVLEACEYPDHKESEHLAKILFYIRRHVCNEESHIHDALKPNLPCIQRTIENARSVCVPVRNDQKKTVAILRATLLETRDSEKEQCLDAVFQVACNAVQLGEEYGLPVGDAYLDIVKNISYNLEKYPDVILNQLHRVVNTFRSVADIEKNLTINFTRTD